VGEYDNVAERKNGKNASHGQYMGGPRPPRNKASAQNLGTSPNAARF
jgi:hypothetical protein